MRFTPKSFAIVALLALSATVVGAQAPAQVDCDAQENGKPATARFRVLKDSQEIAKGSCGSPQSVPPGSYEMVIQLDGAADGDQTRKRVEAQSGQTARAKASFETGELVVDVTRGGRRSVGMVRVSRDGSVVATLSAGVASRLSTGTYTVEVESRGEKRVFDAVTIARGERRALTADFADATTRASEYL